MVPTKMRPDASTGWTESEIVNDTDAGIGYEYPARGVRSSVQPAWLALLRTVLAGPIQIQRARYGGGTESSVRPVRPASCCSWGQSSALATAVAASRQTPR